MPGYPAFLKEFSPSVFVAVPQVLVDGDHGKAASWRKRQAIDLTSRRRPDLIERGGTWAIGG